jgi:hypothetical protein
VSKHERYRIEEGKWCIDVRLKSARQLFDLRDPAPFRERDLDPGAVDYLLTSIHEIPRRAPVRIAIHIAEREAGFDRGVLTDAIRAHFEHERNLVNRAITRNFRHGRYLLFIGAFVLALFLTLSHLSSEWQALGFAKEILSEGLVITGWVAMWRPAESLLYDWWPLYEQRRFIDKLLVSEIKIDESAKTMLPQPSFSKEPEPPPA